MILYAFTTQSSRFFPFTRKDSENVPSNRLPPMRYPSALRSSSYQFCPDGHTIWFPIE